MLLGNVVLVSFDVKIGYGFPLLIDGIRDLVSNPVHLVHHCCFGYLLLGRQYPCSFVIACFQSFAQHTDFRIFSEAFVLVQTDDILDKMGKTGVIAYTTVVSTVKGNVADRADQGPPILPLYDISVLAPGTVVNLLIKLTQDCTQKSCCKGLG